MKVFIKIVEFLMCYFMMALMWVGAEYIFEGAVHKSVVDAFFCAMLSVCMLRLEVTT